MTIRVLSLLFKILVGDYVKWMVNNEKSKYYNWKNLQQRRIIFIQLSIIGFQFMSQSVFWGIVCDIIVTSLRLYWNRFLITQCHRNIEKTNSK